MRIVRLDGKSRYADGRELVTVQIGPDEFLCQVPDDYDNPDALPVDKSVFEAVRPAYAAPKEAVVLEDVLAAVKSLENKLIARGVI